MKLIIFAFHLFMLMAATAAAAEARISIRDAVKSALTNNLELRAASFRINEARARLGQAGRLANPELETEFEPNVRGREYAIRFGFNQRLPVTSRLRLEKQLSRLHLKVAESEVNDFRRKLALEIHLAAVRLAALDETIRVQNAQLENTTAIAKANAEAVKVGEASEIDSVQIELAADRLRLQQARVEMQRVEANRELLSLIGKTNQMTLSVEGGLPAPEAALTETEIDLAVNASHRARVESAEEAVKLARVSRWDDISVGLFTGIDRREDLPMGLQTDHTVGVRLAVPLPLWNRSRGHIAEAEATAERLESEAAAFRQTLANETAAASGMMDAALKALATIRNELLPKARQMEERLLVLHKEGQTPFTEILRARERRFELEAASVDALRDYHLARARKMAATGTILQPDP